MQDRPAPKPQSQSPRAGQSRVSHIVIESRRYRTSQKPTRFAFTDWASI